MTAAVLTRFFNSEKRVMHAFDQVIKLGDKVTWRIMYSKGTDNTEEVLDGLLERWDVPNNLTVHVTKTPRINAQEAICRLFEEATEDELYIFDDDNWLVPNRVKLQNEICPYHRGICAVRTVGIRNGGPWNYYPMNTEGMDVIIDAGAMRLRSEYAKKRLVPATRKAMVTDIGPGLYEDRFWTALAIKDGELCVHPYPLHYYQFRDDGQMAVLGWEKQRALFHATSLKIVEALQGRLTEEEMHQVFGAELMREG